MAVNEITINGVPQLTVRDTTAAAADVTAPKIFTAADGVKTTGTGSGGGGGAVSVPRKAVNFIDYDGTVLYAYTAAEFAALAAMPANPTHTGLTAQGWNWTLSDAKTHVAKYGALEIGQMYITADGKTHIDIVLDNPDLLSPYLKIAVNGTVTIDWGDNSALDTVTGTSLTSLKYTQHIYAATGAYTIKVSVVSGRFAFYNGYVLTYFANSNNANRRYNSSVVAVRLGSGITSIDNSAFSACYSLQAMTIPDGVTSIGSSAFINCASLQALTIPDSVTSIGSTAFSACYSLQAMTIPDGITSISGNMFNNCASLQAMTIPDGITSIGASAFYNCAFLQAMTIPDGVTSIDISAFSNCQSLQALTIPDSVTSIGGSAFAYCYSLMFIRFEPTTPPTVSNSNAFSSLPTDCIIYVPSGKLADYTSAANYPSSATYTYVEY